MNQERLNALWHACGGCEIEALRVRPFNVDGKSITVVHSTATLQTMVVIGVLSSDGRTLDELTPETYIRKRNADGLEWGNWQFCSGDDECG